MIKGKIVKVLEKVVGHLVIKNYSYLYETDVNKRLSASEIELAIKGYTGNISFPPKSAFNDFFDYGDEYGTERLIEFDLWFDNQKSDLTLGITVYRTGEYSIEDIHVLQKCVSSSWGHGQR
jgi:hypothetical protein